MTPVEFVKKMFNAFLGVADMEIDYVLPTLHYVGRVSEFEHACGTDANTFYALNAFATCPRSYLLRYLLKRPLSIPFYEQVQEVVREVVADEATGRIRRDEMPSMFAKLYGDLVAGPLPIHHPEMDWLGRWRQSVGDYIAHYSPAWERRGWKVREAYLPVSVDVAGRRISGVIDLLLEDAAGEFAIVVHDAGCTTYLAKRTGKIVDLIETQRDILDLKRRAYLYGEALSRTDRAYVGKIREIILNLYKPKSKVPFEIVCPWREEEYAEALRWMERAGKLIDRAMQERDWPAAELLRSGGGGVPEPDINYCYVRCPNARSCQWAGCHPEVLKPFTDVTKVTALPQQYIGMTIRLRDGLDRNQRIMSFKETAVLPDGRSGGVTKIKSVVQKMGLEVIGDLEGKRISDFFGTNGCGRTKLELILKLFYDVCP